MRTDILNRKDEILEWISKNQSKAFICKQLKCKPETLEGYLKKFEVEYKGNPSGKGIKRSNSRKSVIEYLKSSTIKSHTVKLKLIEDGIKEHKCEVCLNTEWLGDKIPLELHHIDGNRFNNVMDNFQLLCPNCHAKCDNNSGKGSGKYN